MCLTTGHKVINDNYAIIVIDNLRLFVRHHDEENFAKNMLIRSENLSWINNNHAKYRYCPLDGLLFNVSGHAITPRLGTTSQLLSSLQYISQLYGNRCPILSRLLIAYPLQLITINSLRGKSLQLATSWWSYSL